MKITQKQLLMLNQTAIDSCLIDSVDIFSLSLKTRKELVENILNQQSDKLIDIKEDA